MAGPDSPSTQGVTALSKNQSNGATHVQLVRDVSEKVSVFRLLSGSDNYPKRRRWDTRIDGAKHRTGRHEP
jgi:hypothetical protein